MRHPFSTYRLQIRESFTLDEAAEVTGYLRDLGVSWAYLSPILEATPGSDHGYDVVDVTQDADALALVRSLGYVQAPIVVAGEDHWSGFRPDRIDALAKAAVSV